MLGVEGTNKKKRPRGLRSGSFLSSMLVTVFILLSLTQAYGASIPAFVQKKELEVTSGKQVSVTFSSSNTAGNLIVAYAVWDFEKIIFFMFPLIRPTAIRNI